MLQKIICSIHKLDTFKFGKALSNGRPNYLIEFLKLQTLSTQRHDPLCFVEQLYQGKRTPLLNISFYRFASPSRS